MLALFLSFLPVSLSVRSISPGDQSVREFLRKNGKIIMTILSVALMIVFALPVAKPNRDSGGEKVGQLNGKSVSAGELAGYANELQLLRALRLLPPGVPFPSADYCTTPFPETALVLQNVEEEYQATYWFMLC